MSESAANVGAGVAVPAEQRGCLPMSEVFKLAVSSFKVHNWSLFGPSSKQENSSSCEFPENAEEA